MGTGVAGAHGPPVLAHVVVVCKQDVGSVLTHHLQEVVDTVLDTAWRLDCATNKIVPLTTTTGHSNVPVMTNLTEAESITSGLFMKEHQ